jgi:chloramphenicol 3-O phosphotransferase
MFRGLLVLNGVSSAGKTSIARCFQHIAPEPWLLTGIDTLLLSLPVRLRDSEAGLKVKSDGTVAVGPEFRAPERAWMLGTAATARAGTNVIVDEVFLGGAASQARWRDAAGDVPVRFVAVRCATEVAARRELARGDRVVGLAEWQAPLVHEGVEYDFAVDTTSTESMACAEAIAAYVAGFT